jgi:uncharacterized protein YgiM (DUF1202 family)
MLEPVEPERPAPRPAEVVSVEKVEIFRQAETRRAEELMRQIEQLQADLQTAEAALVEAESGLAGMHTRAEAVSSLAVARIEVERAASRAPWRAQEVEAARAKLVEAERQVSMERFGAALFFVYRARRVADGILDEVAGLVEQGNARLIHARRVNLRAGPSTSEPILAVLDAGTPVFPQTDAGEWVLVQVSGGPTGWVHSRLIGESLGSLDSIPAAPRP